MAFFQLDPTGKAATNLVVGEGLTFIPNIGKIGIAVLPIYGPFFMNGLVVRARLTAAGASAYPTNTDVVLKKWVDYIPVLPYVDATTQLGQAIYAGILLLDPAMAGSINLAYQSLGGITTPDVDRDAFNANLDNSLFWKGYAEEFSVSQDLSSLSPSFNFLSKTTMSGLVASVQAIGSKLATLAVLQSDIDYSTHAAETDNPHNLVASQVGLERVPNWATASTSDALVGTSRSLFVTPAAAAVAITSRTSVPLATDTAQGTVTLNYGLTHSEASDQTKALTTAGLLTIKNLSGTNQIKALFEVQRKQYFFTPSPLTYPRTCLGKACANFEDLVSAVGSALGIVNIQGSAKLGCIWLPYELDASAINFSTYAYFGFSEGGGSPFGVGIFNT